MRLDFERKLAGLREIREIMNSMKALAFMETRKLQRLIDGQRALLATVNEAAADLLQHFPELATPDAAPPPLTVLIGSQRGFCGDFNSTLLAAERAETAPSDERDWILVGRKLMQQAGEQARASAAIDGPDVAEDVDKVLASLVLAINREQHQRGRLALAVRSHGHAGGSAERRLLLPPWQGIPGGVPARAAPPILNLGPRRMLRALVDHFLLASLQEILLTSLWAENDRRARHLDAAVSRLDERVADLRSRCQRLRQEEITEEIEVILLSAEGVPGQPGPTD